MKLIPILIGIVTFTIGILIIIKSFQIASWPSVYGRITYKKIITPEERALESIKALPKQTQPFFLLLTKIKEIPPFRWFSQKMREEESYDDYGYEIKVEYVYEVKGKTYKGHNIRYKQITTFWRKKDAENFINNLPETVKIYYNPSKPEEAYLFKPSMKLGLSLTVFGLIITVFFGLLMLGNANLKSVK
jgi:hypothetical protein